MRHWWLGLVFVGAVGLSAAQDARRQYDPVQSFSEFASYSNDSSHILLGTSYNRRILTLGASWNRRILGNSVLSWRYQLDVLPVVLISDPYKSITQTNTLVGNPIVINFPIGTFTSAGLTQQQCASGTGSGNFYQFNPTGGPPVVVGTYSYTQNCSRVLTYGGGMSPLGQKVSFLPRHKVQPYVAANAGFLMFTRAVPADDATKFSFSFEGGAGVEVFQRPGRSWALDVRYHHFSNDYTGEFNPGVDSAVVRLSYSFQGSPIHPR